MTDVDGVESLYESLARFQWWRRRIGFARAGERLAMHKRLAPPAGVEGPPAGAGALGSWLVRQLPRLPADVLDVGCGFGAIAFAFAREAGVHVLGITSSRFQVARARSQAKALRLAEHCEFRVQDLRAPLPGRFDAIVSIETLGHVPELADSIRHLAATLRAGGHLLLLEDMAADASVHADPDALELQMRWHGSRLHAAGEYDAALRAAGLQIVQDRDLTAQVALRPAPARLRSLHRLLTLRRWAGGTRLRDIADAFLGGLAMERLYARGRLHYRMLLAETSA